MKAHTVYPLPMDLTVIIPSYNRKERLTTLLKSVSAQEVFPQKVIIVDDASTSPPDKKSLKAHLPESVELEIIKNTENKGAPACRNQGAQKASTEYITFVDDDDYWKPNYLLNMKSLIEAHPQTDVFYSAGFVRGLDDKETVRYQNSESQTYVDLLKENFILSPGVIIRRSLFNKVGGFDLNLPSSQDWDLWVRLAKEGNFKSQPEPATVHVEHAGPRISTSSARHRGYKAFYKKHFKELISADLSVPTKAKALMYVTLPSLATRVLKGLLQRN